MTMTPIEEVEHELSSMSYAALTLILSRRGDLTKLLKRVLSERVPVKGGLSMIENSPTDYAIQTGYNDCRRDLGLED